MDHVAPTLEDAISLAAQAHRGQVYPGPSPEPFIFHPLRVMLQVDTETDRIVAVLHDLVEDTTYTFEDVRSLGYADTVIEALNHLTRRNGEPYDAYTERVAENAIAQRVKLADLADNLANNRRLEPTVTNRARIRRYEQAQARLLLQFGFDAGRRRQICDDQ